MGVGWLCLFDWEEEVVFLGLGLMTGLVAQWAMSIGFGVWEFVDRLPSLGWLEI